MRGSLLLLLVLATCAVAAAPVPLPSAREAAQLVEKLGSPEYSEREAATRRLEELGLLALDALRVAARSEDPEVAERAKDLIRKVERRISSDRLLAPTLVELNVKDQPLDAVLAALSKQAGCEVVLGGSKADELAAKKITVATEKVPFWAAVLKVCDAADLQLAGACGFVAPGSLPYYGRPAKDGAKVRAADPEKAVVLESRTGAKKRPASVHGAVLVEAFEAPKGAVPKTACAALLQFWPEPRLTWQAVAYLKPTKAADDTGRKLTPDFPPAPMAPPVAKITDGTESTIIIREGFNPNPRQALARFKQTEEPAKAVRELTGSAFGFVRSDFEPLATVTLDPKKVVSVTGRAGIELSAEVRKVDGKPVVEVKLVYDPLTANPVRTTDDLPDIATDGFRTNRTVHGIRVADANGRAFTPSLVESRSDFTKDKRLELTLTLAIHVEEKGPTVPARIVFWGTVPRPVEVPFTLKDVPLK